MLLDSMDVEVNQEDLMASSENSDQQMAEHLTLAMECSSDVIRSTENHEEPSGASVSDVTSTMVPNTPPTQSQFEVRTDVQVNKFINDDQIISF